MEYETSLCTKWYFGLESKRGRTPPRRMGGNDGRGGGGCPICVCNVQQFLPAFAVLKGRVCLSDACSPGAAHILFSECQHTDTHTHFYLIKSSDILYSALPTARLGSVLY